MFICMQKINFITHFFLKILQRNSKLVISDNLDMPGHTHLKSKMILSIWRNLLDLSTGKKSTLSFTFSLRYCKDIANLLFSVLWTCLATHTQGDTIHLQKTFLFICMQIINFILHVFLEILERHTSILFWVIWTCLVMHTQNVSSNLQKLSMFICIPKINFVIHFFLEILCFKESCNLYYSP